MRRRLLGVFVCGLGLSPAITGHTIDVVDDAKLPRFEVASIKPGDPGSTRATVGFPPGRFVQENMNLLSAFTMAFGSGRINWAPAVGFRRSSRVVAAVPWSPAP